MANTKIPSELIADNAVGITQLNVSDGSDGQVLTTNGSGTLSFSTVSGGGSGGLSGGTYIYMSSDQNIGRNTVTLLQFNSVTFGNSGTPFSTTNYNYTVPSAGKYLILGTVMTTTYATTANAQIYLYTSVYKNGSEIISNPTYNKGADAEDIRLTANLNYVVDLAQNDVIDFRGRLSRFSGTGDCTIDGGNFPYGPTYIYIVKIES